MSEKGVEQRAGKRPVTASAPPVAKGLHLRVSAGACDLRPYGSGWSGPGGLSAGTLMMRRLGGPWSSRRPPSKLRNAEDVGDLGGELECWREVVWPCMDPFCYWHTPQMFHEDSGSK